MPFQGSCHITLSRSETFHSRARNQYHLFTIAKKCGAMLPEQREKLLKSTPGWIQVNEAVTKHVQLRWTQKSLDARIDAEGARADRGGGTDKAVGKADRLLKQLTSFIGRYRCTLGILRGKAGDLHALAVCSTFLHGSLQKNEVRSGR